MSQGEEYLQHRMQGSPIRTQSPRPTAKNRKVVLVGETFLSTKQQTPSQRLSTGSFPSVSLESPVSPHRSSVSISSLASTHSTSQLWPSPVNSPRSSLSSIVDISTMSSLVMTPLSEDHVLEELRQQIASSAEQIHQLERKTKQIPVLQGQVDDLQRERSKLANNLQDHHEVAKNLKQRIAMLHEQNSQLGKLLKSQQGGSDEVVSMRNTIMASLAQLRQLQEQVNTIPGLKIHINTLEQERDMFSKTTLSSVPARDSQALLKENSCLKATNAELMDEMKVVREQLNSVSQSCDGLKHRVEAFESAQARSTNLREQVKRLEAEKDSLYHEIIDLKFHHRRSPDMDSVELNKQIVTLQKANIQLRNKLQLTQHEAHQQKEQLVLKLFQIEALNVKTHKYELEKRVLEMEQLQAHSEFQPILQSADAVLEPLSPNPTVTEDTVHNPEFKIQMLKLEQLRIHSTQSRNVMQALLCERDELEKRVAELSSLVEEKGIEELMEKMGSVETRLSLAVSRNEQLERELNAVLKSGSSEPSAAVEIERLYVQLEKLKVDCSALAESNRKLEKKYQHQKEAAQELEIFVDEKKKAERKYKESKEKLRALAKELTGSVTLLKDYQDQCSSQENELQQMKLEMLALRGKYAAAVTELEVAKAENRSGESETAVSILLSGVAKTPGSDQSSVLSEGTTARGKVEHELEEVRAKNDSLTREVKNLHTAVTKISESLSEATAAKLQLEKKLEDSRVLVVENTKLVTAKREKEEELISKCEEILSLRSKLQSLEEQLLQREVRMKGESELSAIRQQVVALNLEKQSLCDQLKERELKTSQFKENEKMMEKELAYLKQELEDQKNTISANMRRDESRLEENVVAQEQRIAELQNEMEKLRNIHTNVSMHYRETLEVNNALEKQIYRFKLSEEMKKKELAHLKQELEDKKNELDTISAKLYTDADATSHLDEKVVAQEQRIVELQNEMEKLRKLHTQVTMQYKETLEVSSALEKRLEIIGAERSKEKQNMEQKCLEVEQRAHSASATVTDHVEAISALKQDLKKAQDSLRIQRKELQNMQSRNQTLNNEVEGYQAMVNNLTRQIDQAEARELDHEVLRQKVHRLEAALSDSSSQQLKVDNQALFTMLQEAVNELPSPAVAEGSQSLREENLRLEQQVSVLSQWNDKQRQEIEKLEGRLDELLSEKESMAVALTVRESNEGEVMQLRRELHETEQEVNTLRRQVRADLQEEMQVKVETQSQILSVFSEHNQRLQQQVEELQQQVRLLGGRLTRQKAVSPPPFPDPTNTASLVESSRTLSEMTRENEILSRRLVIVEEQLSQLKKLSASVRRRSSNMLAITSIPVAPIHDDVQIRYMYM